MMSLKSGGTRIPIASTKTSLRKKPALTATTPTPPPLTTMTSTCSVRGHSITKSNTIGVLRNQFSTDGKIGYLLAKCFGIVTPQLP